MNARTLKTKITRVLKEDDIHKVVMRRGSTRMGTVNRIVRSGYDYFDNEIRWYSKTGDSAERNRNIRAIYKCLCQNGFAEQVEMSNLGLGEIPVINLKGCFRNDCC